MTSWKLHGFRYTTLSTYTVREKGIPPTSQVLGGWRAKAGRYESKIISPGSVNQSAEQHLSLLPLQVFWLPQYPDLARIKEPHAMIQAAPWAQWELHGVNKTCLENKTEYK